MMKRMGGILMLLAILAVPAQAQRQGRMRGPDRLDELGDRDWTRDLSADAIIRLQDRLDLSDDQVEELKEAQRADRDVRDALRFETRGMRDRLRDGEITRAEFREEMAGRRTTELDGMRAYRENLDGVLNDEQRSEMRNLRRQSNRGGRVRRGGPPAGRSQARGQFNRGSRGQQERRNMRPPRGGR